MLKRLNTQPVILYFDSQPPWLRYMLAVLIAAVAAIIIYSVHLFGECASFLLFSFTIIPATLWLGMNHRMVVMALSLLAVNWLVLLPAEALGSDDIFLLNAGFCVLSFIIIATGNLHRNLTKELWQNRQDLYNAQAVGQIGSWRLNMKNNDLLWSDENYHIFGISKGAAVTYQDFLSIVHPDDRNYVDQK
jgi:K+-sensing histidine kinase KdpD